MDMDVKDARKRLEGERAQLGRLIGGVHADLTNDEHDQDGPPADRLAELSPADQHPADLGSEVFEQEKTYSILASVRAELHEVERALERIRDRSYGRCEACHRPIPAARLQALPAARYCLKDQVRAERESRAS
jgi:RNA polymerase-binding transcription factor